MTVACLIQYMFCFVEIMLINRSQASLANCKERRWGFYIIVTYAGLSWLIIMGSGFDYFVYWHFFAITAKFSSSHVELRLNYELRLLSHSHGSLIILGLISTTRILSQSLMLRPTVSWPVCLGIKLFIAVRQLRVCWCGALSLTRGRVCNLQLLLVLASAVILGSESRGTRDHILLSQIPDFPFRRLLRLAGLRWTYSTQPPESESESESQNYFTTGGPPPISSSRGRAPWDSRPDFFFSIEHLRS
jgi:hypothetical protein